MLGGGVKRSARSVPRAAAGHSLAQYTKQPLHTVFGVISMCLAVGLLVISFVYAVSSYLRAHKITCQNFNQSELDKHGMLPG